MKDTFSANSLKSLEVSYEAFKRKYIDKLELINSDDKIKTGNKFHILICYYLKGFNTEKFENSLDREEFELFQKIKKSEIIRFALSGDEKFIEQPFFVQFPYSDKKYYLTGRFDSVIKKCGKYYILDWKTTNIPKNPEDEIQTLVYLFAASKLYKTDKIEMIYYSLEKDEKKSVLFTEDIYIKAKEKIESLLSKLK